MAMFRRKAKKKFGKKKSKKSFQITAIQKQLLIGFVLFFFIAVVLTGVWFGTRIDSMQIKEVSVVGGFTIPHAQISTMATETLNQTYFRLIPHRFKWLYPRKRIQNEILEIDRVKNVRIELVAPDIMAIAFEEHKPYALWCGSESKKSCVFIDSVGYAFAQAPALTGSAFVRYVKNDDEPVIAQQSFEVVFIDDTERFIAMLEDELSLYVTQVHKLGDYDIEYAVSGGGLIKVSQTIAMQDSFDNLKTVLTSIAFEHIEPGAFQYIDLRFGDKVFINEEDETATSSTETESVEEASIVQ